MASNIVIFALSVTISCLVVEAIRVDRYTRQPVYQPVYQQQPIAYQPTYQSAVYQPQPDLYYAKQALKKKPVREQDKPQDLSKVPGVPGVDYPTYHEVPHTNFHCGDVPVHPGMYANVEAGCQAYHTCHDGREGDQGASFLCANGTLFNQHIFACDWWYNVDCAAAPSLYSLNADPEKNPFVPKRKPEEELKKNAYGDYYKK